MASCKKEEFEQAQRFGTVLINNQSGLNQLQLAYNNELYINPGSSNSVKIPAGKGLFSFIDPSTKNSLLDTSLTIEENSTQELVLFRQNDETPLILLQNTQANEPVPEDGYIKLNLANLAKNALPNPIKIIAYQIDENIGDVVPIDTLDNVQSTFGNYVKVKQTYLYGSLQSEYYLIIVDAATNTPLSSIYITFLASDTQGVSGKVITAFIEEKLNGTDGVQIKAPNGKTYGVQVKTLFSN
ncbi:hypothetical protein GCM10023149_15560 [Mucilaginibacter gynuensis]|uniref:DUF4397 domain-containing protein n=1 Tax=Mucilaginibacter gynuensis TaxID=1302236 RepID=A0ABP8G5P7_9SPHI